MFHEKLGISPLSPLLQWHPIEAAMGYKEHWQKTIFSQSCKSHIVLEYLDNSPYPQELKVCSCCLQCPQKTSVARIGFASIWSHQSFIKPSFAEDILVCSDTFWRVLRSITLSPLSLAQYLCKELLPEVFSKHCASFRKQWEPIRSLFYQEWHLLFLWYYFFLHYQSLALGIILH